MVVGFDSPKCSRKIINQILTLLISAYQPKTVERTLYLEGAKCNGKEYIVIQFLYPKNIRVYREGFVNVKFFEMTSQFPMKIGMRP